MSDTGHVPETSEFGSQSTERLFPGNVQPPQPTFAHTGSRTALAPSDAHPLASLSRQSSHVTQVPDPRLLRPDLERMRAYLTFQDRFPGISNPSTFLSLVASFGKVDTTEVLFCLHLEYPRLVVRRDEFFSKFEELCQCLDVDFEKPQDGFWNQSVKKCFCKLRARFVDSPHDAASFQRQRLHHEEIKQLRHDLESSARQLYEEIDAVYEKLMLLNEVKEDVAHLLTNLEKYEARIDQTLEATRTHYEVPDRSDDESPSSTPSLLLPRSEKDFAMPPRVDSSSTGFQPPPSPGLSIRNLFHSGGSSYDPPALPTQKSSGGKSAGSQALNSLSSWKQQLNVNWQDRLNAFKALSFTKLLGHKITVWALVLLLAFAGAVTTGVAVWGAAPEGEIPQTDGNFWSNLSQNLVGAAGLYCIIIPILRNVGVKGTDSFGFRLCLVASGIGAFISIGVYPVQLRTSMVLAYLSSLFQLLATLQVLEDAAATVGTLGTKNTQLKREGDMLVRENVVLTSEVDFLERRVAHLESAME